MLLLVVGASGCAPRTVDYEQISRSERLVARFSHVTAENSPKHLAAMRFAGSAREKAGGRVEIQVYPNSQLYRDGEELAALQEGAIEFLAVAPSKLVQFDPAWQVFDLPYLFTGFDDVERLFASPVGRRMRQKLEARGLMALAIWPNGFKQFTNRQHPLVSPADFQGLTFRAQAGQVLHDQFLAVGAQAVVSSFNTLYADIESGQIDGQENTPNNIYTRNLPAVQPYVTISDHGFLAYVVLTRAAWWQSLAPDTREALQGGLQEATAWVRANAPVMNDEALAKLRASGRVEVRTLTVGEREELRAAFEPVYKGVESRLGSSFLRDVLSGTKQGQ
ncbi:MAG TPA: DctP family TRAP transporter solute-binding subunit [Symbiobacteriaceae bacterium]|nr:DctP family TRAP transporter solute-binding subunit [Symbiobacteriaceae bacterium]